MQRDVRLGYLSADQAQGRYGVVLDATYGSRTHRNQLREILQSKEIEYRFNHRNENLFKQFLKIYFSYVSP